MWYSAVFDRQDMKRRINMRLAYAESDDGVHWIKPKLGLREFRGSSDNNLCALNRECYNCQVLYEPEEPRPERRFKMIYTGYHHRGLDKPRLCVAYSPDGLRWVDHPKNPVVRTIFTETGGLYRWKGIYYANGQTLYPQQNGKRTMVSFASANLDSWQEAGIMSFHRPESKLGIHRGRQVHVGASIWHRRNVLLGLYGQWVGPESNLHPDVRMNLGLIISNDGLRYREPVPDYPFIRWGSEQSDWKTLRLLQGQGFVNHGGRTYIFYGAASGEEVPVANHCMVGLATLPRDRFGHLQPRGSGAMCITNTLPTISGGARLAVTADGLGTDARLRVEALDHRFQPIVGHAGESAASVRNSGLRESITWSTGAEGGYVGQGDARVGSTNTGAHEQVKVP